MIDTNEIKKVLYKEKPIAKAYRSMVTNKNGDLGTLYIANTSLGEIRFAIPIQEKPEGGFKSEEPAQLLIRWLV